MIYLTAQWSADPKILPTEVKKPDDMQLADFHWRPKTKLFNKEFLNSDKYNRPTLPISFGNITLRHRLAMIHCRLTFV